MSDKLKTNTSINETESTSLNGLFDWLVAAYTGILIILKRNL